MFFNSLKSRRRAPLLVGVAALFFIPLIYLHRSWVPEATFGHPYLGTGEELSHGPGGGNPSPTSELACRRLHGADDVLVVMKTGATESRKKLPIHFETTFRCIPHWIIFSDLEEDVVGHHVHDVLDEIEDIAKEAVDEFGLYEKIQTWHAQNKMPATIDEALQKQAWDLDKWKFLPLVKKALQTRPEAKWYYFMEADTSLIWSNLLLYLSRLNPDESVYLGAQAWIADTEFAHGGSGFLISRQALHKVVEEYTSRISYYNELTRKEWAGDLVLAKALKSQGVNLTRAFPVVQGETPYTLDYTERHWCFPVVSYHHMPVEWIKSMWDYEQEWLAKEQAETTNDSPSSEPIRHRNVFAHFVQPTVTLSEKPEWHNLSPDQGTEGQTSLQSCKSICEAAESCVQWLFTEPGDCKIANVVRLGSRPTDQADAEKCRSGWMSGRIAAFVDKMGECRSDWILPDAQATVGS